MVVGILHGILVAPIPRRIMGIFLVWILQIPYLEYPAWIAHPYIGHQQAHQDLWMDQPWLEHQHLWSHYPFDPWSPPRLRPWFRPRLRPWVPPRLALTLMLCLPQVCEGRRARVGENGREGGWWWGALNLGGVTMPPPSMPPPPSSSLCLPRPAAA